MHAIIIVMIIVMSALFAQGNTKNKNSKSINISKLPYTTQREHKKQSSND